MQEEYWVNVYNPPPYCYENLNRELYNSRSNALLSALSLRSRNGFSVSYRIHVRMKEVKGLSREYPLKMIKGHDWPVANVKPKFKFDHSKMPQYSPFKNNHHKWMEI